MLYKHIRSFCIPALVLAYSAPVVAEGDIIIHDNHGIIQRDQASVGHNNTNTWNNKGRVPPQPESYSGPNHSSQSSSSNLPEQRSAIRDYINSRRLEQRSTSVNDYADRERLKQALRMDAQNPNLNPEARRSAGDILDRIQELESQVQMYQR